MFRVFKIFGVLICGGLVACITPFSPSGMDAGGGTIVIEGDIILNGDTKVYVSESRALEGNESVRYLSNAIVSVQSDQGEVYMGALIFSVEMTTRPYYLINTKGLPLDRRYWLSVSLPDGRTFYSEPQTPLITPEIDSIEFFVNESKTAVDFTVTTYSDRHFSPYYRWTFTDDWEVHSYYHPMYYFDPLMGEFLPYPEYPPPIYYCWNRSESTAIVVAQTDQLENNTVYRQKVYTIGHTSDKISVLYANEVQQISLSLEAHRYWETLRKNTDEIGGIFAPQPSEQYGNIHTVPMDDKVSERVLGYISVGTVATKRLFVSEEEIDIYNPEYQCANSSIYFDKEADHMYLYRNGYRVSEASYDPMLGEVIWWALAVCVDCTTRGTKNKPSFWPNDHI